MNSAIRYENYKSKNFSIFSKFAPPSFHIKIARGDIKMFFSKIVIEMSFLYKLEHYPHWFTSSCLFCKSLSNLVLDILENCKGGKVATLLILHFFANRNFFAKFVLDHYFSINWWTWTTIIINQQKLETWSFDIKKISTQNI